MPGKKGYTSKAQQGFMNAKQPEIAKKMNRETPKSRYKKLPEHVKHSHSPRSKHGR